LLNLRLHQPQRSFVKAERVCTAQGGVLLQLLDDLLSLPFLELYSTPVLDKALGPLKDVAVGFQRDMKKVAYCKYAPGMIQVEEQLRDLCAGKGAAEGQSWQQRAAATQVLLRGMLANLQ
jgi:hypothetical protein